jgi:chaperonin GroEL
VLASDNPKFGYNAATGNYEDLMAAGIIDPTKVSYYVDLYPGGYN